MISIHDAIGLPTESGIPHLVTINVPSTDVALDASCLIVYCLDVSSSMATPRRLPPALAAIRCCIEALPATIHIGLVTFADQARVVQSPTSDHAVLLAALGAVQSNGGTNLTAGLSAALDMAGQAAPGQRVHLVLLTDGEPTVGPQTWGQLAPVLQVHPAFGSTVLHVIGMDSANPALLQALAYAEGIPNGSYSMMQRGEVAAAIGQVLGQILALRSTSTTLAWSPIDRLMPSPGQFPVQIAGDQAIMSLGALHAGKSIRIAWTETPVAAAAAAPGWSIHLQGSDVNLMLSANEAVMGSEAEIAAWHLRSRVLWDIQQRSNECHLWVERIHAAELQWPDQQSVFSPLLQDLQRYLDASRDGFDASVAFDIRHTSSLQRSVSGRDQPLLMSPWELSQSVRAQSFAQAPDAIPALELSPPAPFFPIPVLARSTTMPRTTTK